MLAFGTACVVWAFILTYAILFDKESIIPGNENKIKLFTLILYIAAIYSFSSYY